MNIHKLIQIALIAMFSISGSVFASNPRQSGLPLTQGNTRNSNLLQQDQGQQPARTHRRRQMPVIPAAFPVITPRSNAQQPRAEGQPDVFADLLIDMDANGANQQPGNQPAPQNQAPANNAQNPQAPQPAQGNVAAVNNNAGLATRAGNKIDSMCSAAWNCMSSFCQDLYASAFIKYDTAQQTVTSSAPATFTRQHGSKILGGLACIVGAYLTYRLGSYTYNSGYTNGHTAGLVEGIQTIKTAVAAKN